MTASLRLALIAVLLAVGGCGPSNPPPAAPPAGEPPAEPAAGANERPNDASASPEGETATLAWGDAKVKFKDGADQTKYSLKTKPDGAKLVDGSEAELARYTVSGAKLKIKDPDDKVLGYVVFTSGHYKVEDAEQKTELFKLQKQTDGDWKLEDGGDALIYKIKRREYGWEIEDPGEQSLFKIKVKEGKTSIRDAGDQTVVATKDQIKSLAAACLALEAIADLRVRAALAVLVDLQEGN